MSDKISTSEEIHKPKGIERSKTMKWNKAIDQIEKAIADGKFVEVSFHRKWARNCNEYKTDKVDAVGTYDWNGETLKFVDTWQGYGLEEGNFIIDEVIVK